MTFVFLRPLREGCNSSRSWRGKYFNFAQKNYTSTQRSSSKTDDRSYFIAFAGRDIISLLRIAARVYVERYLRFVHRRRAPKPNTFLRRPWWIYVLPSARSVFEVKGSHPINSTVVCLWILQSSNFVVVVRAPGGRARAHARTPRRANEKDRQVEGGEKGYGERDGGDLAFTHVSPVACSSLISDSDCAPAKTCNLEAPRAFLWVIGDLGGKECMYNKNGILNIHIYNVAYTSIRTHGERESLYMCYKENRYTKSE